MKRKTYDALDITGLSHDGRGIAKDDGKAVFVRGALPDEQVSAIRTQRKRTFEEATVVEVLKPSPLRQTPKCQHFGTCGGCVLQHFPEDEQIKHKQSVMLEAMTRIGKVTPESIAPPLQDQTWAYRRKARLGVKWVAKKEKVLVGFREQNPRYVADLSRCLVLIPEVGEKLDAISACIERLSIKDQIAQIEVASGDDEVVLVLRNLAPLGEGDEAVLTEFAQTHGFAISMQPKGPSTVTPLVPTQKPLSYALDDFGLRFVFEPLDFTQVNPYINRLMMKQAMDWLAPSKEERILDLFCGLGNFTLPLATLAGDVVGVEGDQALVQKGRANAELNELDNASFYMANLMEDLSHEPWMKDSFDAMLLDPPRSGADKVLEQMDLSGIPRILYVSCHPGSLARDAGYLVHQQGYRLVKAGVMDMFPHTAHVESMALFVRD